MPRSRPARERRLEPGEEERLLKACAAAGNIWLRRSPMWAIETATRQGGILGPLRRPIRGSVAYLPDTKTARPRSMPLSSRALGILQDVPAAIGGVAFPTTQNSLEYYWCKACGAAGIGGGGTWRGTMRAGSRRSRPSSSGRPPAASRWAAAGARPPWAECGRTRL
jgi:hypothetical protein